MRTFISGTVRSVTVLALVLPGLFLPGATPAQAQPVNAGVAYLAGSQAADGSWQSLQVRQALATTEALRALQVLGTAPVHRQSGGRPDLCRH